MWKQLVTLKLFLQLRKENESMMKWFMKWIIYELLVSRLLEFTLICFVLHVNFFPINEFIYDPFIFFPRMNSKGQIGTAYIIGSGQIVCCNKVSVCWGSFPNILLYSGKECRSSLYRGLRYKVDCFLKVPLCVLFSGVTVQNM